MSTKTSPATAYATHHQQQHQQHNALTEFVLSWTEGPREFIKESVHLINRCTKPDRRGMNNTLN